MRSTLQPVALVFLVSIHASRCREAMPTSTASRNEDMSFNPRLPLPGGDAAEAAQAQKPETVSIHASRCREAMRLSIVVAIC